MLHQGTISSKFKQLLEKGNPNDALRLLTNNITNGILPLSKETLLLLQLKHPEQQDLHNEVLLQDPIKQACSIALVMKAAIKTKGGCGPSGIGAEYWFPNLSVHVRLTFENHLQILLKTFESQTHIQQIMVSEVV